MSYTANDPVNKIDPSGKFAIEICIANSLLDTAKKAGELLAEIADLSSADSKCSNNSFANEQKRKTLQSELDSLSSIRSAYYKCAHSEQILSDRGI